MRVGGDHGLRDLLFLSGTGDKLSVRKERDECPLRPPDSEVVLAHPQDVVEPAKAKVALLQVEHLLVFRDGFPVSVEHELRGLPSDLRHGDPKRPA